MLALCEEDVFKLQFPGPRRDEHAKELLGYLKTIESGLNDDGDRPETYLETGRRALTLARLSRTDETIQFCTVSLPSHWNPNKAYPLYVQLHGRGPSIPLAYVNYTFQPRGNEARRTDELIIVVPWLRGNSQWRDEDGSEPDIWEAIDDVKSFAKLDADRWYISGHSWGGDDTWAIVQRTPDVWAAAGIMAGNPNSAPIGLGLVSNASHVPFYLWLGDQDKERRPAFETFRAALTAVGNPPGVRGRTHVSPRGRRCFASLAAPAHSSHAEPLLICHRYTTAPRHLGHLHSKKVSVGVPAGRT